MPISPNAGVNPVTGSKIQTVVVLLKRDGGASVAELTEATSWLPHTIRAALTGLRKKGHEVARVKANGMTRYVITDK